MIFAHPLARSASLFTAKNNDGSEYRALAIVTTLELDPQEPELQKTVRRKAIPGLPRNIWPTQMTRPRSFS
jgi:hypothetical protein